MDRFDMRVKVRVSKDGLGSRHGRTVTLDTTKDECLYRALRDSLLDPNSTRGTDVYVHRRQKSAL